MASFLVEKIYGLSERDGRFKPEAFVLVMEALDAAVRIKGKKGHVTGRELLEGLRRLCLKRYGPTTKMVLNHLGLFRTEDVGELVFLMVDAELLSKRPEDRIEDFREVYDFEEEFVRKYRW